MAFRVLGAEIGRWDEWPILASACHLLQHIFSPLELSRQLYKPTFSKLDNLIIGIPMHAGVEGPNHASERGSGPGAMICSTMQ